MKLLMKLPGILVITGITVFCCVSCSAIKQSGTHDFRDGYYRFKTGNHAPQKVYAVVTDSSLAIHLIDSTTKQPAAGAAATYILNRLVTDSIVRSFTLIKRSLDIDLSTILLKYRFRNNTLPNQLSSNLNAALYTGYRHDYFRISDAYDPLLQRKRVVKHFEFDMGVFAGFGSTPINPSTTAGFINAEYDGLIFQKGIALFIGARSFTFGIGLGTDRLLDKNKNLWIYQEKPWMGVMIGLNLTN